MAANRAAMAPRERNRLLAFSRKYRGKHMLITLAKIMLALTLCALTLCGLAVSLLFPQVG